MVQYIALLRGINVSGQRLIRMEDLRFQFAQMGFQGIRTYIQSGNVLFETPETDAGSLRNQLEGHLYTWLGYPVTILVRSQAEMAEVAAKHPFGAIQADDDYKRYVAFLSEEPNDERQRLLLSFQNGYEAFHIRKREVYVSVHKEAPAKVVFSNNWLEKKLGVLATTRNWATVTKLGLGL